MNTDQNQHNDAITSYRHAPSRTVTAAGVTYAYRELGPKGGVPVIFFVHLAATLDNWDPRIIDPIAQQHHVIAFDNRGVGASTGTVPDTVESMADDAYAFITALGFDTIDIFSFSLGGMIAQALLIKHPELVRKLILTGTGPAGGQGIDKVAGTTYYDMLRATLTRQDPKEFLFFNRDDDRQTRRTRVRRTPRRTHRGPRRADHGEGLPNPTQSDQTLGALNTRRPVRDQPADIHRERRQRPHGPHGPLRRHAPSDRRLETHHLPRLRPWCDLPIPPRVRLYRNQLHRPLTSHLRRTPQSFEGERAGGGTRADKGNRPGLSSWPIPIRWSCRESNPLPRAL